MFTRKIIAGAAGLFLLAGGVSAVTASASGPGAGACQVTGKVTSTSGIDNTPSTDDFAFQSVTINCTTSDGDDSGAWTVSAHGTAPNSTCAGGPFSGSIDGGSSPSGSEDGSITGGSFTGARGAAAVAVEGTIVTSNGETHTFVAHLIFQPTDGVCNVPNGTGLTHNADIATGSTAAVTE